MQRENSFGSILQIGKIMRKIRAQLNTYDLFYISSDVLAQTWNRKLYNFWCALPGSLQNNI